MPRRLLLGVFALVVLAAACGVDDVEDVLDPSGSPSTSASPSSEPTEGPSPEPSDGAKPAIVVRTPAAGDEIVSPVTVVGTADVFEGTVSIRIVDANGQELAATFTTATCGTGCRGRYSEEVFFFTEERQDGTIEVFESSAADGSPLNLVRVPVVLVPGI
ncbi:MAG: Gmad2 immunoglobulin-like domain-containing protein [Actinomycetota bacterium]